MWLGGPVVPPRQQGGRRPPYHPAQALAALGMRLSDALGLLQHSARLMQQRPVDMTPAAAARDGTLLPFMASPELRNAAAAVVAARSMTAALRGREARRSAQLEKRLHQRAAAAAPHIPPGGQLYNCHDAAGRPLTFWLTPTAGGEVEVEVQEQEQEQPEAAAAAAAATAGATPPDPTPPQGPLQLTPAAWRAALVAAGEWWWDVHGAKRVAAARRALPQDRLPSYTPATDMDVAAVVAGMTAADWAALLAAASDEARDARAAASASAAAQGGPAGAWGGGGRVRGRGRGRGRGPWWWRHRRGGTSGSGTAAGSGPPPAVRVERLGAKSGSGGGGGGGGS